MAGGCGKRTRQSRGGLKAATARKQHSPGAPQPVPGAGHWDQIDQRRRDRAIFVLSLCCFPSCPSLRCPRRSHFFLMSRCWLVTGCCLGIGRQAPTKMIELVPMPFAILPVGRSPGRRFWPAWSVRSPPAVGCYFRRLERCAGDRASACRTALGLWSRPVVDLCVETAPLS